MSPRRFILSTALVFTCARAAIAQTQQTDADETLIVHGLQLREQGQDREALGEFTRAWEMGHSPRARAQMALAEQALGEWIAAYDHMSEALAAQGDPWITTRHDALENSFAVIRRHVGRLAVVSDPPGAEVRVDNELRGRTPLARPIAVLPGSHAIDLRLEGHSTVTRTVTVAADAIRSEEISLPSVETTGPVSRSRSGGDERRDDRTGASAPVAPWVVVGVGVAGIAAGAVFMVLRGNELEAAARDCGTTDYLGCAAAPTQADYDRALGHYNNAVTDSWVAGSAFAVGGVAVAAGLVWYLVARPRGTGERSATAVSDRLRFFVVPGQTGASFGIGGVM